jgi:hypothetical protein
VFEESSAPFGSGISIQVETKVEGVQNTVAE